MTRLFLQERETKNYYISDLTKAHTLEYQSHSAFIVALEFARNVALLHVHAKCRARCTHAILQDDPGSQIKAGLLMTLSVDK